MLYYSIARLRSQGRNQYRTLTRVLRWVFGRNSCGGYHWWSDAWFYRYCPQWFFSLPLIYGICWFFGRIIMICITCVLCCRCGANDRFSAGRFCRQRWILWCARLWFWVRITYFLRSKSLHPAPNGRRYCFSYWMIYKVWNNHSNASRGTEWSDSRLINKIDTLLLLRVSLNPSVQISDWVNEISQLSVK